jgi:transcriptional regulator with XRE-family HTH domain
MMENLIGIFIKTRLKELKQTQGWLAEKAGVSNVAVTKWIKSGKISRENAVLVADALNTTIDKLLGNESLTAENELERQLLLFFRGMTFDHQDELLSFANFLYSKNMPDDKSANPFPAPSKFKEKQ